MKFALFAMRAHCCLIQFGIQCNTQVFLSKAPHSDIHNSQSGNSWYIGLFQPERKTALLTELHEVSIHQILHFLKALLNKTLFSTTPLCQLAVTCKLSGIVLSHHQSHWCSIEQNQSQYFAPTTYHSVLIKPLLEYYLHSTSNIATLQK